MTAPNKGAAADNSGGSIIGLIAATVLLAAAVGFGAWRIATSWNAGQEPEPMATQTAGPQVGQTAPEIEGEDLDGQKFKLSDYRGKVVLLDFWGHW